MVPGARDSHFGKHQSTQRSFEHEDDTGLDILVRKVNISLHNKIYLRQYNYKHFMR